nr:uncharacterized protein LOC128686459 isoform X1 [Cherax quadricarinatus]
MLPRPILRAAAMETHHNTVANHIHHLLPLPPQPATDASFSQEEWRSTTGKYVKTRGGTSETRITTSTGHPPTSPSSLPALTTLAEDPAVLQAPQDLMYNTFPERGPRWLALDRLFRMLTVGAAGVECVGQDGRVGECVLQQQCRREIGTPTSSCTYGYASCCVAYYSECGFEVTRNKTYWVSPQSGTSSVVTTGGMCNLRIKKITSSICFIRLDLIKFKLMSPVNGSCTSDHLVVSGQNINAFTPKLCGENSGQHLYVDVDTVDGPVELSITTVGKGLDRQWEIKVSQIECSSPYRPPANCLQYFTGAQGTLTSFNYVADRDSKYLNNLNYAMCIRKEAGFCSVVYQTIPSGNYTKNRVFEIVNFHIDSSGVATSVIPSGEAGLGLIQCPDDYLIMAGTRLCGERLNDGSNPQPTNNGPITDKTRGPFIVQFTSDGWFTGQGFQLIYQQYPC